MAWLKITSFQNPSLKEVQHLRESQLRKSTGLTIVEGTREVVLAWKSKVEFQKVFIVPELLKKNLSDMNLLQEMDSAGIQIVEVSKQIFTKISYGDRLDGLLAICRPRILQVADMGPIKSANKSSSNKPSLWVVVEDIEKPGNLGAILRTCDASGVDGIFVCGKGTDLYNPNVIRASLGAIFGVRVILDNNEAVLKFFKNQKIQICATTPSAEKFYTQVDFRISSALVLGSEEEGLSDFWFKYADFKINVPMLGKVDSLNVSTTTAVILYEVLRQRNNFKRV